jgi:zinc protease
MKLVNVLARKRALALAVCLVCVMAQNNHAQSGEPQRDQLLNGLRILLWSRPGDQTVALKLRIHSGAAFDTSGKAGTMALLGDILFPDQSIHDYFTGEMGGRLDVETDYDAIEITLEGRASEYDRIVDTLRTGLVTTPLTPENLLKLRQARLKKLSETKASASEIANQAIADRVLGNFPYAHPIGGTAESLAKIERADLMLARDRFLTPNNATLTIVGGVDSRRAMRALRQLLGGWRKSEQIIPATFRQPDPPDKRTLILNATAGSPAEVRIATRGVSRSDRDFFAMSLLAVIARERWSKLVQPVGKSLFVKAEPHALPDIFVMGAAVDSTAALKTLESGMGVMKSLATTPATPAEMVAAKNYASGAWTADARAWLDIDTFGLPPISEQSLSLNALSAADLQRVAARLFNDNSISSVIVGNVEQLKQAAAAGSIRGRFDSYPGSWALPSAATQPTKSAGK